MLTEAGVEFDFDFVLTQPASAYSCPTEFDRDHEAVNGATIDDRAVPALESVELLQPDMTILVAQYTPCGYSSAWCQEGFPALHDAIEPMANLSTAQSTVIVVDMFTDFSLDDLADAAHPNDSGDEEMARRWMTALTASGVIEAASGTN